MFSGMRRHWEAYLYQLRPLHAETVGRLPVTTETTLKPVQTVFGAQCMCSSPYNPITINTVVFNLQKEKLRLREIK